ncbi:DUF4351 domain-containing protein [Alcanivorax sp. IO_7]|nr:DUF4351 domain-containing protein [Alcanivorax sp. IO_7]
MQYVTSFERLAKEEGVEQGKQQGMQQGMQQGQTKLLILLLTHRFGPLPDEVRQRVGQVPSRRSISGPAAFSTPSRWGRCSATEAPRSAALFLSVTDVTKPLVFIPSPFPCLCVRQRRFCQIHKNAPGPPVSHY